MNYLELSSEDAKNETLRLAQIISRDYEPDSVVFISKGAYQIGLDLGGYFRVPVLEIVAGREADKFKAMVSPLLKILPPKLKALLRRHEARSGTHRKNGERNVHWGNIPLQCGGVDFIKILLVDDSCDTGNSFVQCAYQIHSAYPNAEIRTAAINVFTPSFGLIRTDYYLYTDCMLSGPWSKDSREHRRFEERYAELFGQGTEGDERSLRVGGREGDRG